MKNKLRYFMVLTALVMCFGTFSVTAYAQSNPNAWGWRRKALWWFPTI